MSEEMVAVRKNHKKALGRGLGSLLGEAEELTVAVTPATQPKEASVPDAARIWNVAIEKIQPNKEQPRKVFEPSHLQELAASLKEKGMLLPIVVRRLTPENFEIIAGERRWRAAQLAGLQEVPIIIRQSENREALELALIENIQRQNLNPLEEAEAYHLLANKYALTQQQIAEKVSKERTTITNLMRLVSLAAEVKTMLREGELQLGQAKVLLGVEDLTAQVQLAKKVVRQKLSVRATEKLVIKFKETKEADIELDEPELAARDIQPLIAELQKLTGTKVDINATGQRSRVSFHFYSVAELNQFIEKLRSSRR